MLRQRKKNQGLSKEKLDSAIARQDVVITSYALVRIEIVLSLPRWRNSINELKLKIAMCFKTKAFFITVIEVWHFYA